jgi:peptidylprolyl isomerase
MIRSVFTAVLLAASAMGVAASAQAPSAAPQAADWRTPDPQDVLVIETNKGRIIVEMVPEAAPVHVARVRELAREKLYDGLSFFRVVDNFMAQTGDPQNTGEGGSTKPDLAAEIFFRRGPQTPMTVAADLSVEEAGFIKSLPVKSQSAMLMPMMADGKVRAWGLYCPGVAGMARAQEMDSANSQFFLMRAVFPALDQRYTAWGRVISGQEVVTAIKTGEPVPEPRDTMIRVRVLADIPEAERPKIRVIDPAGAWFKAEIARVRSAKGDSFSVCDITLPTEVR